MNLKSAGILLLGVGLLVGGVSAGIPGMFDQAMDGGISFLTAVKWGAVISAVIGIVGGGLYLLVNKDGFKRKVVPYGSIGFMVHNGRPRRYKRGKKAGQLKVRRGGQGMMVIPKIRDMVIISWLLDTPPRFANLEAMHNGRRLRYDLVVEYSLPPDTCDENVENLRKVAFEFEDRNRYNEEEGTFNALLRQRVEEVVLSLLTSLDTDPNGLPVLNSAEIDWLTVVQLPRKVRLAELRVRMLNPTLAGQVEIR